MGHARAQAKEEAETKKALADPLLAGLMPDNSSVEANLGDVDVEGDDEGEADEEMDRLFSAKVRRKGAKRNRQPSLDGDADAATQSLDVTAKRSSDADLLDTLELISGKAPRRVKK